MENKDRFKFEWELFKDGLLYCIRVLLHFATIFSLIFAASFLVIYTLIVLDINDVPDEIYIGVVLIIASILYKLIFPWLNKGLLKILTKRGLTSISYRANAFKTEPILGL